MSRDLNGNYTLPAGNPVAPNTDIESVWANSTMTDIAAALTDSLSRTGLGGMLAPFFNADGNQANPGMSWANEPTSGWYRKATGQFWYSVAGQDIFGITSAGVQLATGKVFVGLTIAASAVTNVPAGSITATDVQNALNQLDILKAPKSSPTFVGLATFNTMVANGDVVLLADFSVAGTSELGATNVTGDLNVTGLGDFGGNLAVAGDVTLENLLAFKGALAVGAAGTDQGASGQALVSQGPGVPPKWITPAGAGDVTGPAGAVADNLTAFDGVTGKLLKDSGLPLAQIPRKDQNNTFGGTQAFATANITLLNTIGIRENALAVAVANIDTTAASYFSKTATAPITFTVSNVAAAGDVSSFILDLANGGAFLVTWWANIRWAAGAAPTLTVSGRDALGFYTTDGGVTWTGLVLGLDIK